MIRDATADDLDEIVAIYNASIPGRLATADLTPVSVDSRRAWFAEHDPAHHPLWIYEDDDAVAGWLSLGSFYQRAAWDATAEVSVYVSPGHQKRGLAATLVSEAISRAPEFGLTSLVALIFGHNQPSLNLFHRFGFDDWGNMPEVCDVDGIKRDVMILGRHVA
ncbi:MAG: GNAT family N-acetyltransferase [Chloroflexi bacterium]|nr:GNAT family N-acetyltransferase [Chloroflexota bacterium]